MLSWTSAVRACPHKNGDCTLWPNLNRLSRLVPCGKGNFTFDGKARNSLDFKFVLVPSVPPDSVAPTLHSKNGRGNTFFTERSHSEQSAVGLTGSYELPPIAQAEVRKKCQLHPCAQEDGILED